MVIVRVIKSASLIPPGQVARRRQESAFKILTGKISEKTPLGRSRCRWEGNIRMDLNEIVVNTSNWNY